MKPSDAQEYLYVPKAELEQALAVGAVTLPGEARLAKPRPLPPMVRDENFARWMTPAAKYQWTLEYVRAVFGDGANAPDIEGLLETIGTGTAANERVYLFVTSTHMAEVRGRPGVDWDRRRRMAYATPRADLTSLFQWLTPAARALWEADSALRQHSKFMLREAAAKEAGLLSAGADGGLQTDARSNDRPATNLSSQRSDRPGFEL